MGNCGSSGLYNPTGKLILEDGELIEFVEPLEVAQIMRGRNDFFICHSDSMDIDQYLSPLPAKYKLKVGHLYFEIPVNRLGYRLPASDMADLAMKACAAMKRGHYQRKCDCKIMAFPRRNKLELGGEEKELNLGSGSETVITNIGVTPIDRRACGSRLSAIPEGVAC